MKPSNETIETAVLGTVLSFKTSYYVAAQLIGVESFSKPEHRIIWEAMQSLDLEGKTVDTLTVSQAVSKHNVTPFFVADLTKSIVSDAHLETHCRILQEFEIKRLSIKVGTELAIRGGDESEDPFNLLSDLQTEVVNIANVVVRGTESSVKAIAEEIYQDQINSDQSARGVKISLHDIDRVMNGWQGGHLSILAARPGMGKTTLALQQANECISSGVPVGFISLEMTAKELISKLACQRAAISHQRLRMRELYPNEIQDLKRELDVIKSGSVVMDDRSSSFVQIRAKAVSWVVEKRIELLIVDYLQLISFSGKGSREQEISSISRGLKMLSKELDIPILALSQLSRACESRSIQKPKLSDLRESGAIEQDADEVLFIWRPESYGHETVNHGNDKVPTKDIAQIELAKNRHGVAGFDTLAIFDTKSVKFDNYGQETKGQMPF